MKLEDKKTVHEHLLLNLESQQEMINQIDIFKKKLELKKSTNPPPEVDHWNISELESRINEIKDLLHGFETVYKELLHKLVG